MAQSSQKINTLTKSHIEEFIINHLKLYSPPISDQTIKFSFKAQKLFVITAYKEDLLNKFESKCEETKEISIPIAYEFEYKNENGGAYINFKTSKGTFADMAIVSLQTMANT